MAKEIGTDKAEFSENSRAAQKSNPHIEPPVERVSALRVLMMILIPVLIIVGCWMAMKLIVGSTEKEQPKDQTIRAFGVVGDRAFSDNFVQKVTTTGEARPRTEIDLVPEVGGKVVYVSPKFIQGGTFRKGETLIRIDDSDYKVGVIRAESGVAQAEQALAREVAEGEIARRDLEELGIGNPTSLALREPQRQQAQAALQAANAELESAKLQLKRTYVKAPFNGRVTNKTSDIGQFVSPGFRLGRIFSTDVFEVRLPLNDPDLAKLKLPIAFAADSRDAAPIAMLSAQVAGETQLWESQIMRTDSSYDPQTRSLFAIAEIHDPYGKGLSQNGMPLAPGLSVSAEIEGQTLEGVVVLPRAALRERDKVYVVDEEGQGEIRRVDVITTTVEYAVLKDGVSAGEVVIVSPMEESRIRRPLKVSDVNDSKVYLIDTPDLIIPADEEDNSESEGAKKDEEKETEE